MKTAAGILALLAVIAGALMITRREPAAAQTHYSDGTVQVDIAARQTPAKSMETNAFTITVSDAAGRPIGHADLHIALSMPGVFCGTFPAEIVEERPGTYVVKAVPVMRGRWQAETKLETGTETIRVVHPFLVE